MLCLPRQIQERLLRATHQIVGSPEFTQKLRSSGADVVANQPAEFAKQLQDELAFWAQLARTMPNLVSKGQ